MKQSGRSAARIRKIVADPIRASHRFRARFRDVDERGGHWIRAEMDRSVDNYLAQLGTPDLSVVEISGTEILKRHTWLNAVELSYPAFDVCRPPRIETQYDVVICNQVLEHVVDPLAAAKTLRMLCKPEGTVIVGVPFLLRIHPAPLDLWRFTPDGLRVLLEAAGLEVSEVHGWGNGPSVRANLYVWAPVSRWGSMRNDEDLPVVVWAFCRRPPVNLTDAQ